KMTWLPAAYVMTNVSMKCAAHELCGAAERAADPGGLAGCARRLVSGPGRGVAPGVDHAFGTRITALKFPREGAWRALQEVLEVHPCCPGVPLVGNGRCDFGAGTRRYHLHDAEVEIAHHVSKHRSESAAERHLFVEEGADHERRILEGADAGRSERYGPERGLERSDVEDAADVDVAGQEDESASGPRRRVGQPRDARLAQ